MNRAWTNSGYLPPTWPFGGGEGGGSGGEDPNAVHHYDFNGVESLPVGSTIAEIEGKVNVMLGKLKGALAIALSFSFLALGAAEIPPDTPLRNVNTLTTVRDMVNPSVMDSITNRDVGNISSASVLSNSVMWRVARIEEASNPVTAGAGILVSTNNAVSLDPEVTNTLWIATTDLVHRASVDATNYVDAATNANWIATTDLVQRASLELTNYVDVATNDNWIATTDLVYRASVDATNYVDAATNANWIATTDLVQRVALELTNYVDTATNDNWIATTDLVYRASLDATNYTDSVVKGLGAARPLPKYLHEISFDTTYPDDAKWYYEQAGNAYHGSCSVRRTGDIVERNYDWNFDDSAVFVVRMSAAPGRFASIGMAGVGTNLTEETVTSGKWSRYYKCLPGHMLDGINEKGVFAEINVVPGDPRAPGKWPADTGIHPLAAVRWVLDNADSAEEAALNLRGAIAFPEGWTQNFHYMVADASGTWMVEDGTAIRLDTGREIMTNFKLNPWTDGPGIERYNLLLAGEPITNAWYSRTYAADTNWRSEFDFNDTAMAAAKALWAAGDKESHRGQTDGTNGWWQTVHTSVYDIQSRTMMVSVQETDDWYGFRCAIVGTGDVTRPEFAAATNDLWEAKVGTNDFAAATNGLWKTKRDLDDFDVTSNVVEYISREKPVVTILTWLSGTQPDPEDVADAILGQGCAPTNIKVDGTGSGTCDLPGTFTYDGKTFLTGSSRTVIGGLGIPVFIATTCNTESWTEIIQVAWTVPPEENRSPAFDRIATTNGVANIVKETIPGFSFCEGKTYGDIAEIDIAGFLFDCDFYDGKPRVLKQVAPNEWLHVTDTTTERTEYRMTASQLPEGGVLYEINAASEIAGVPVTFTFGTPSWTGTPARVFHDAMSMTYGTETYTSDVRIAPVNRIVSERALNDALANLPSASGNLITDGTNTIHSDRTFVMDNGTTNSSVDLNFTIGSNVFAPSIKAEWKSENAWSITQIGSPYDGSLTYDPASGEWTLILKEEETEIGRATCTGSADDSYFYGDMYGELVGFALPPRDTRYLRYGKVIHEYFEGYVSMFQRSDRVWECCLVGSDFEPDRVFLELRDDGHWWCKNHDLGPGSITDTFIRLDSQIHFELDPYPGRFTDEVELRSEVSRDATGAIPGYSFVPSGWEDWGHSIGGTKIKKYIIRTGALANDLELYPVASTNDHAMVWKGTTALGVDFTVTCEIQDDTFAERTYTLEAYVIPGFPYVLGSDIGTGRAREWHKDPSRFFPNGLGTVSDGVTNMFSVSVIPYDGIASQTYVDDAVKSAGGGTDGQVVTNIVRTFEKDVFEPDDPELFPHYGIPSWYLETSLMPGSPMRASFDKTSHTWTGREELPGMGFLSIDIEMMKTNDVDVLFSPHVVVEATATRLDLEPFTGLSHTYDLTAQGFGVVDVYVNDKTSPLATKNYVKMAIVNQAATEDDIDRLENGLLPKKRNSDDPRGYVMTNVRYIWQWMYIDPSEPHPEGWDVIAGTTKSPTPTYNAVNNNWVCDEIYYCAPVAPVPAIRGADDTQLEFTFTNFLDHTTFRARALRMGIDADKMMPKPTGDDFVTQSSLSYRADRRGEPEDGVIVVKDRNFVVPDPIENGTEKINVYLPVMELDSVRDIVIRFDNTRNDKGVLLVPLYQDRFGGTNSEDSVSVNIEKFSQGALSLDSGKVTYVTFTGFANFGLVSRYLVTSNEVVTE